MVFIRSLVLMALTRNKQFKARHILGKSNIIADSESGKQWEVFQAAEPYACQPSSAIYFRPIPDIYLTSHIQSLFNDIIPVNTKQTQ